MFAAPVSFTCIRRFVFFHLRSLLFFHCLFFYTARTKYTRKYDMDDRGRQQRIASPGVYVISRRLWLARRLLLFSIERLTYVSFLLSALFVDWNKARGGRIFTQTGAKRWSARENSMNTFPSSNAHAIFMCLAGAGCLPVCVRSLQNTRCCHNAATQIYRNLVRSYIK